MILIRPYQETDHNFICSSYLKSTYFNSIDKSTRMIKKINHDRAMDLKINDMLVQSLTLIACPENDPDLIAGYFIFTHDCAHYIYVKESFRKLGVAAELFKASGLSVKGLTVSHLTQSIINLDFANDYQFDFNPFKVF